MNRILLERSELEDRRGVVRDGRARHIATVLGAVPGQVLRAGIVDGPLAEAEVISVSETEVVLELTEGEMPVRPVRDLLLAMPRPKVLRRLLPQLAAIGVDRLWICGAQRVEPYYFASHVLEPARLRAKLVEGCVQSGDPALPAVRLFRRFDAMMEAVTEEDFPVGRVVLHPGASRPLLAGLLAADRTVLAIGPEGGWMPDELAGLGEAGFVRRGLGERIYRSDTACVVALGLLAASQEIGRHHASS